MALNTRLTAVGFALCAATSAAAQDASNPYVVEGPGRTHCAAFAKQPQQSDAHRLMAAWMAGYLTAHNRLTPQVFDFSAWQSPGVLVGLLAQYCAAHPDRIAENGAQDLIAYLAEDAIRDPAEVAMLEHNGSAVLLYVPVIARVRAALSEIGHQGGSTDFELVAALKAYQQDQGLDVTGLPDQATLARLLR